jgi:hypothetical protein
MKKSLFVASHQQRTVQRSAKRERRKDTRKERRRRSEASERRAGNEEGECIDRGLVEEEQGKMILMCV